MRFARLRRALGHSLLLYGAAGTGCGSISKPASDADAAPVGAPPVNSESAGTVQENASLDLNGRLISSDADSATGALVYTVEALPADGQLQLDGAALEVGSTFTQEDVDQGRVLYLHGGAENAADEFTWQLTDDGGNRIPADGATPFAIEVTPVNDAPAVVNNAPVTMDEGASHDLTADTLLVSDAEEATPLVFTLVDVTRGTLRKRVADGPFELLPVGGTFTQEDVEAGNLRFVDPGNDDANLRMKMPTAASFSWRVEDPGGLVNPSEDGANVTSFTVNPVDDPAVLTWRPNACYVANTDLPADPLATFSDIDNPNSEYTLCVVSIGSGSSVYTPTGASTQTTMTVTPTIRVNATNLTVGSCLQVNARSGLFFRNTTFTYGGSVTWELRRSGAAVEQATMEFLMSSPPC